MTAKLPITAEDLRSIYNVSRDNGTLERFGEMACLWAEGATLHMSNEDTAHAIERAKWQQELRDWQQRATGGMCRCLSAERCDCGLCERDRQIADLLLRLKAVEADRAEPPGDVLW